MVRFEPQKRHFYVAIVAVLASLFNLNVDPKSFSHEESGVLSRRKGDIFKYITDIKDIPEWFPVFRNVYELDSKVLRVGKRYKGEVKLAQGYSYTMDFEVKELVRGSKVVISSENLFKPVMTAQVSTSKNGKSTLSFSCYYDRPSALFQYTLGPILKFLTMQHMRHSLFVLHWLLPPSVSNGPDSSTFAS
ncbi:hypothetical protein TCAL_12490 [Tigriopus californicus]|uniref:Coenzyme Q-binding protein COQ10 START domain-containing protein n=1 Tax=Tigriopus californicus TaxID=6832 RepID=A0A553P9W5_TIGCA|nr:uncharacterized protein LOC131893591 isoform X2 [Tigriopus californicus]TRY74456.1 hypothetical protein TCAL_12490 [Tigriopus californicus]